MTKALLLTLTAFTLAACGSNSSKTQKSPSTSGVAQRLHQESMRLAEVGVAATAESIAGEWCSIDPQVGKKATFAEKNVFTLVKKDGSVQTAPYFFNKSGKLNIGGETVEATIAEETESSPKVLSLVTSASTELMEPCGGGEEEQQQEESKEKPKQEQGESQEQLPEAPKST